MTLWADKGIEPPDSNYPCLHAQTLVALETARKAFPNIPSITFPPMLNELELLDFGPLFGSDGGVLTELPPLSASPYFTTEKHTFMDAH